jgi:methyl coenzyme M reductase beta subunit
MRKPRKNSTPYEKIAILRRPLIERVLRDTKRKVALELSRTAV